MRGTFRKLVLAISATVALAACADNLGALKSSAPSGSEFSQNLADEYLRFARFEAEEMYDWPDADLFAEKGLSASKGIDVAPENPDDWALPVDLRPQIGKARRRLVATFEIGLRDLEPATAAKAQAKFDCWVEQQEENWQTDHIAACRQGFLSALDKLETTPEIRSARLSLVLFPFDSSQFEADEFATLSDLVKRAQGLGFADIQVTGHTDRAGSATYNMRLSLARADRVRAALIRRGLPASLIRVQGKGETELRVVTPDGVREAINRRVEIVLTKPEVDKSDGQAHIAALH